MYSRVMVLHVAVDDRNWGGGGQGGGAEKEWRAAEGEAVA